MHTSIKTKKNPLARAAAACALFVSVCSPALTHAVTVSPGGSVTLSGSMDIALSSSPILGSAHANCPLTITGTLTPGTGSLSVTSANFANYCRATSDTGFSLIFFVPTDTPINAQITGRSGNWQLYSINFPVRIVPEVQFSPPYSEDCVFPNFNWWRPTSQVNLGGYPASTSGGTCSASSTLTASPAQTFSP